MLLIKLSTFVHRNVGMTTNDHSRSSAQTSNRKRLLFPIIGLYYVYSQRYVRDCVTLFIVCRTFTVACTFVMHKEQPTDLHI